VPLLAESSRADLRRFTQADLDRIAAELKAASTIPRLSDTSQSWQRRCADP
jgi:hypothetical protein